MKALRLSAVLWFALVALMSIAPTSAEAKRKKGVEPAGNDCPEGALYFKTWAGWYEHPAGGWGEGVLTYYSCEPPYDWVGHVILQCHDITFGADRYKVFTGGVNSDDWSNFDKTHKPNKARWPEQPNKCEDFW